MKAWVFFVVACSGHEFGTKLPRNFVDFYEPLYGKEPSVSQDQLAEDLEHLKGGAENGFMLKMPAPLQKLGLTHQSLLGDGSYFNMNLPARFQQSVESFMTHLREFKELLDWDKEHEEQQQESWERVAELRKSGKMQHESIDADLSRLQGERDQVNQEQASLTRKIQEQRRQEEELKEARRRLDEQRRAAERRAWSFSSSGDPIICPENADGEKAEEFCVEYKGPATVMCFDELGKLQSLDFVGVCDEDGRNCQSPDAEWVGEQWRFELTSRQFLYRNVAGQKVADVSCHRNWTSQALPSSTPDPQWLDAFNGGRSFILHARQPRITDGPSFDFIWRALMDEHSWDFDSDHIGQWINAMLMAHGYAKEVGFVHETVPLLAQYAVFYGLVASRK